ncbi:MULTISPECIES: RidA family protein [unclassified Brenneria]|uniref:RidA family protein n=1 Tax=unclassified Brenneria TaxID=2634434 RepID=UPI001557936A|nr:MULTISPECIES: RidA family protein [unclassified Brenneria]MBJ7223957.1 RidA family protein [Brenneria sp. L3-3C-1]MEE3645201.1 RidA family protein [Brenneria sp. L3_3C_1]MEE3649916.1 RidA family protein [Brenneria sp. HEZEL_4_2_4]NPC99874.1 RidA family protein [Brenneria sp. hezel4-2-4]
MITRYNTNARMSTTVEYKATDSIVVISGQVADDLSDSVAIQTQSVLDKIEGLLKQAGCVKTDLIAANIWLTDITRFDEMNGVWDKWVPAGHAPARVCVETRLPNPLFQIEVQVTCLKKA